MAVALPTRRTETEMSLIEICTKQISLLVNKIRTFVMRILQTIL